MAHTTPTPNAWLLSVKAHTEKVLRELDDEANRPISKCMQTVAFLENLSGLLKSERLADLGMSSDGHIVQGIRRCEDFLRFACNEALCDRPDDEVPVSYESAVEGFKAQAHAIAAYCDEGLTALRAPALERAAA